MGSRTGVDVTDSRALNLGNIVTEIGIELVEPDNWTNSYFRRGETSIDESPVPFPRLVVP